MRFAHLQVPMLLCIHILELREVLDGSIEESDKSSVTPFEFCGASLDYLSILHLSPVSSALLKFRLQIMEEIFIHFDDQLRVDEDSIDVAVRENLTLARRQIGDRLQREKVYLLQSPECLHICALRLQDLLKNLKTPCRPFFRLYC